MGLKRMVFRGTNAFLRNLNLELQVLSQDFDARLDQPAQLNRIFSALGGVADGWLERQKLFPVQSKFDSCKAVEKFYEAYLDSPFRTKQGGSRFNNLVWLHLIAKAMEPELMIDSGTFHGASAWAFALAGTPVYSFDIDLSRLAMRVDGVVYSECDWTAFDWKGRNLAKALVYFDDHLDQVRRLIEASERGIPVAIFDDDFPVTSFAAMAGDGHPLPKIEFVLDEQLRGARELSWIDHGRRLVFKVDPAYLDRARALIADTERLADTSLVTGIQQTPYRIVKVAGVGIDA